MQNSTKHMSARIIATAAAAILSVGIVHGGERDEAAVQKKLRAMANVDTDWHPDLAGEFNGMRYYARGQYRDALEQFTRGAYYADKLSQLSIGLMYLNGEGVAKDPVIAYAWLDLAAERGYADFAQTRDHVKAHLTVEQIQRATAVREDLARIYADEVAKPRQIQQLRFGQMYLTGSRVGFDFGVQSALGLHEMDGSVNASNYARCAGPTILLGYQNAPIAGCGGDALYSRTYWQPDKYFASRDALWKAEVTVGLIQGKDSSTPDPADKKP